MRKRLDYLLAALSLLVILPVVVSLLPRSAGGAESPSPPPLGSPWLGAGMWVWYVKSDPQKLAGQLKSLHSRTVFIKAADGTRRWSQLSPELVDYLHGRGFHVCAWQYVYGQKPLGEARAAAAQVQRSGVNCMVIDAEAEYKHKPGQARIYLSELRKLTSPGMHLGFTSFPYVNLHSSLPYRVFLGPQGAEANLPQMYWHEIGKSPGRVVRDTLSQNRRLGRPVYPIGQTYGTPPPYQLKGFLAELSRNQVKGFSWWSLDHSSPAQLTRLAELHKSYR